ncbi:hypothetical protein ACM75K_13400, partial [Pseudomonas aeruginosa]
TDSKSVESAMAPRVQIPISPPLHMAEAPEIPRVSGALSFLRPAFVEEVSKALSFRYRQSYRTMP